MGTYNVNKKGTATTISNRHRSSTYVQTNDQQHTKFNQTHKIRTTESKLHVYLYRDPQSPSRYLFQRRDGTVLPGEEKLKIYSIIQMTSATISMLASATLILLPFHYIFHCIYNMISTQWGECRILVKTHCCVQNDLTYTHNTWNILVIGMVRYRYE